MNDSIDNKKNITFFNVSQTSLLTTFFASLTSTLIIYSVFFHFSEQIWSHYAHLDPMLLTPRIRNWTDHDGLELYVMYGLVIGNFFLTLSIIWICNFIDKCSHNFSWVFIQKFIIPAIFFSNSIIFVYTIGFNPPMAAISHNKNLLIAALFALLLLWAIFKSATLQKKWMNITILLGLIPIVFIATSEISLFDYEYVFSPALRLVDGFKINEIYFQYDLFLSLLAAAWMKLKFELENFRIIAQIAIYLLIYYEFTLAKQLFSTKKLAYYLLASLILIKIYAFYVDPTFHIQLSPLRLDLWIILILILMKTNIYSIFMGIYLALLLIVSRTFGFLYTLSYLEVVSILFIINTIDQHKNWHSFKDTVIEHTKLIFPNLAIISLALVFNILAFNDTSPDSALLYQRMGIGFMRISPISFYWYIPILFAAAAMLLLQQRKNLTQKYFVVSLFLIALGIANSAYFFGRSHESNIIHISAILLWIFILLIDLLLFNIERTNNTFWGNIQNYLVNIIPIVFIVLITFYYSERISKKIKIQAKNIYKHHFIYPRHFFRLDNLKKITNNSDKVYFLSVTDFYFYYDNNYTPQGYYLPYASWPFKKNLVSFLQHLLEDKYYIVVLKNEIEFENEIVKELLYTHSNETDNYKVIWK